MSLRSIPKDMPKKRLLNETTGFATLAPMGKRVKPTSPADIRVFVRMMKMGTPASKLLMTPAARARGITREDLASFMDMDRKGLLEGLGARVCAALLERFGEPIGKAPGDHQGVPSAGGHKEDMGNRGFGAATCDQCGGMMGMDEGEACTQCGAMGPMDEADPTPPTNNASTPEPTAPPAPAPTPPPTSAPKSSSPPASTTPPKADEAEMMSTDLDEGRRSNVKSRSRR